MLRENWDGAPWPDGHLEGPQFLARTFQSTPRALETPVYFLVMIALRWICSAQELVVGDAVASPSAVDNTGPHVLPLFP